MFLKIRGPGRARMKLTPAYLSSSFENVTEQETISLKGKDITHIDDISFLVNMKKLDLSGNKLKSGESLSGLQYCKSLVWLDLSGNQLSDVHHILGLHKLNVLNLSHNELDMIPEGIHKLVNLKALILNDNQIKSLENIRFPSQLNTLILSRNEIESANNAFMHLEHLEKLSFSHNRLHQFPAVSKCWALKEIRVGSNKILGLPKKAGDLPPGLTTIDIGNNAVADQAELEAVIKLRHLVNLNVKGNPLWTEELDKQVIKAVPTMEILNSKKVSGTQKKRKPRSNRPQQ